MKKVLLLGTIITLVLLLIGGAFYWYWKNQPAEALPLQTITLDNPEIGSFDDVCTPQDEYELDCTGNIEQFGCEHYRSVGTTLADLQPNYPMLVCEKKNNYAKDEGVYRIQGVGWSLGTTVVDYIIINGNAYQLIQSEDQFRQLYQPITTTDEAMDYFQALHKAVLALNDQQLSAIQFPKDLSRDVEGVFHVSLESIGLSEVSRTWRGYAFTAYSSIGGGCVDEIYQYQYLLKENGRLTEQSKKLIWESANKPRCIY